MFVLLAFKITWDVMVISLKAIWYFCVVLPIKMAKGLHEWRGDSANIRTARTTKQIARQQQQQQISLQQQQWHAQQQAHQQWQAQQQWLGQHPYPHPAPPHATAPLAPHQPPAHLPPPPHYAPHQAPMHYEQPAMSDRQPIFQVNRDPNQVPRSYRREPFWQAPPQDRPRRSRH